MTIENDSPQVDKYNKYVFLYPDVASPAVQQIERGEIPKERLTGFYQLKMMGMNVAISDHRWSSGLSGLRRFARRYIQIPSVGLLRDFWKADVIVVKDEFSPLQSFLARLMGKRIVYLDTLFKLPESRVKRKLLKIAIKWSDGVIALSSSQARLWSQSLTIPSGRIIPLYYAMDCDFYPYTEKLNSSKERHIISIGRDVGRDFGSLMQAVSKTDATLDLVTLPYLLPENAAESSRINIYERLSYKELFETYSRSCVAVVPLKAGISYPSGIRAVMEAMLMGIPVVATRTPVLEEYFSEGEDIVFSEPDNPDSLLVGIASLMNDNQLSDRIRKNARKKVVSQYNVEEYGKDLASALSDFVNR
ncbi:glycosyltransferase family 4 protein [Marinimicrobium alkaliphilum]|uniref:glycosyltransferase family 4 protein n=1 Tax=Marinimicrobium alkaliphilum TaxID=2202654 RepID=UPI000DBA08F9|nr:glycosyltransferase family 4 protein [Marinimicrobium alkaliphilum]